LVTSAESAQHRCSNSAEQASERNIVATAADQQQQQRTKLGPGFIVHSADKIKIDDLPPIYTNPVNQQSTTQIHNPEKNRLQHIGESVKITTNNNLLLLLLQI